MQIPPEAQGHTDRISYIHRFLWCHHPHTHQNCPPTFPRLWETIILQFNADILKKLLSPALSQASGMVYFHACSPNMENPGDLPEAPHSHPGSRKHPSRLKQELSPSCVNSRGCSLAFLYEGLPLELCFLVSLHERTHIYQKERTGPGVKLC